jgi:hypothetical protein
MGVEKAKSLHCRCTCHSLSPAQNRSISRNERPDTLDPCIKIVRLLQRQNPTSQFSVRLLHKPHIVMVILLVILAVVPVSELNRPDVTGADP